MISRHAVGLSRRIITPESYRFLASQAPYGSTSTSSWSALSASERQAWETLNYNEDSWEGRSSPPKWKQWAELSLEEKSAAMYGLNIHTKEDWDKAEPSFSSNSSTTSTSQTTTSPKFAQVSLHDIPPLSTLLKEEKDSQYGGGSFNDDETSRALVVAPETRLQRQQQVRNVGGALGGMAYQAVKGLAPIVGPLVKSAARHSNRGRGSGSVGLSLAGDIIESIPTMMDMYSGILEVTGIDTLIYLDDSTSMQGSNLVEGKMALKSLEKRLKTNSNNTNDRRFLPTRIVKFGSSPTILNPSEEDWSVSLVNAAWDGSSGGTYMWKMIQDDVQAKYRPAGGKLRIVVITDGHDILSPAPYNGVRGFDPLMRTLLAQGYDIEWNIIVLGNDSGIFPPELSQRDKKLYRSLCHATGGQFLSVGASGWNENDHEVDEFLNAIEDSGYHDSKADRRERQEQYKLEARKGKAENFDWLPDLPKEDDDSKKR